MHFIKETIDPHNDITSYKFVKTRKIKALLKAWA
jgi:hypothetical protein